MKKTELMNQIDWEFYETMADQFAIRGLMGDKEYAINDWVEENSFDWITDEELDGVCAIDVRYFSDKEEQIEEILKQKEMMERVYRYDRYYLLASTNGVEQGGDEGEVVVRSAYVLAEI